LHAQSEDSNLVNIVDNVENGKVSYFSDDFDGVLWLRFQLYVLDVCLFEEKILDETCHSSNNIHPGSNMLYQDFR